MSGRAIMLTHAQVVIDPDVAVPDWGLSDEGAVRHKHVAEGPDCAEVKIVFCSDERKAREGAAITGHALGLEPRIKAGLGENDRSATGYLPKQKFERMADSFFAHPDHSVRGWETARAAQARIVTAVKTALTEERPAGDVLFVSHGGVATLLRCHLLECEITRKEDQPGDGGCWFAFDTDLRTHQPIGM